MQKKEPQQFKVETENDGIIYTGRYQIEDDQITVYFHGLSTETHLGNMPSEGFAEELLQELVDKYLAKERK